jgi:hypothetical protein
MRKANFVTLVVLAAVAASCSSGSGSDKAKNVAAIKPACVVHSQASTTTTIPGHTPFTVGVINGTPVPTTVVQPRCLPDGHVSHALQVAEAIKASGLGCDTASLDSSVVKTPPSPANPTEEVSCDIGDDSISISLWTDHDGLARAIPYLRQGQCYVEAHNPTDQGQTYVEGDNWIAYPQYTTTADRLRTALGGTEQTNHC